MARHPSMDPKREASQALMKADDERKHMIHLVFNDGKRIRTLKAKSEQEVSEMMDHIRARGYVLIAIEGRIPGPVSYREE